MSNARWNRRPDNEAFTAVNPVLHLLLHARCAIPFVLMLCTLALLPAGSQRTAAAAAPAAAPATAAAAATAQVMTDSGLPARLALGYALSRGALEIARIDERFERDGSQYRLTSKGRAVGVAALLARGQNWQRESRGTIGAEGLRPDQFTDQRGTHPMQRARLDWSARLIRFDRPVSGGTADTAAPGAQDVQPLPDASTDRLSFPYAIAMRDGLPDGEWTAAITDGRRITVYRFRVAGHETLDTPAGRFSTIRISRVREGDDNGTDIWFATGHHMIPVRILVTEPDGATFDQVLVKIGLP